MSNTVTLFSRTFTNAPTADVAPILDSKQYIRKPNFGSNWNDIQIAIMCAITPNGTSALPWPGFFPVGMCSGTSGFGSATTTNFIGVFFGGLNFGDTGTYVANSGNPYYTLATSNSIRVGKKVATTVTNGNSLAAGKTSMATNGGVIQRRTPLIVRIQKGSPNYTISGFWLTSISTDIPLSDLITANNTQSPTAIGALSFTSASTTLATDESAGGFDSVNIAWNAIPYPLELYCVYITKFS